MTMTLRVSKPYDQNPALLQLASTIYMVRFIPYFLIDVVPRTRAILIVFEKRIHVFFQIALETILLLP